MKQVSYVISTYTSDVSGVCSAFYEYGGMVVIHDPSGCNSTYNTHDEPRWFYKDSLIFISGLSQMDAVMGNDDKFIEEVVEAAGKLFPRFIILVRSPIPLMIGTDFEGIAREIESVTGIPTYFIPTTGMKSYVRGVGMSLELIVNKMMPEKEKTGDWVRKYSDPRGDKDIAVNLLGVTPLDFSVNSTFDSLKKYLSEHGFSLTGCLSLDTDYEELSIMPGADVNLVLTASGFLAAQAMRERYDIPYVVGFPCGIMAERIAEAIIDADATHTDHIVYKEINIEETESDFRPDEKSEDWSSENGIIVHEPVIAQSMAIALTAQKGKKMLPAIMLECPQALAGRSLIMTESEEEMADVFKKTSFVIADPMFHPICPKEVSFYDLAHEAFSGRTYRRIIPDLMDIKDKF